MKKLKLKDVFIEYRSGRGKAAPAYFPFSHVHGKLPQQWPLHGYSGDPDSAPSVTANRLLQQTMGDDDIEYWAGDPDDPDDNGVSFDPPIATNRDNFGNLRYSQFSYGMKRPRESKEMPINKTLKEFIRESLLEEACKPNCKCEKCKNSIIDEDELVPEELDDNIRSKDEASSIGGGSIAGYTAPLGTKKRNKEQEKINQKSFGGGKYNR